MDRLETLNVGYCKVTNTFAVSENGKLEIVSDHEEFKIKMGTRVFDHLIKYPGVMFDWKGIVTGVWDNYQQKDYN